MTLLSAFVIVSLKYGHPFDSNLLLPATSSQVSFLESPTGVGHR